MTMLANETPRIDQRFEVEPSRAIHLSPGAYHWRWYITDRNSNLIRHEKHGAAITAHIFDTAQDALDSAIAWNAHPYPLAPLR